MSSVNDSDSSGSSGPQATNKTGLEPENPKQSKPSASGVRNSSSQRVKVSEPNDGSPLANNETLSSEANSGVFLNPLVNDLINKIDNIKKETEFIKKSTLKIEAIQTGSKEWIDGWEEKNQSIILLNGKLEKIPLSTYNFFILLFPHVILLVFLLFIIGLIFAKSPSLSSLNTRIDNLSTNITESSPNSQILKLKGDTTDIKNGLAELNKKGLSEIKDLITKIGSPMMLSNDIATLKSSVDKLSANPLNKKDLDEIKIALKTLGDNKSTISVPQFIGQPTEALKFAKELSAELLKSKAFTDEIAKSSNQATKEALKSVDDKIKFIADSIKTNPKNDKIEDSLKSIDENIKNLKDSINKNSKTDKATEEKFNKITSEFDALNKSLQKVHLSSKPNHPFLLICSTTPTFNPGSLKNLEPLFKDIRKTIRKNNPNIDWKMGLEWSSNYIPWFENDKDYVIVDNFGSAEPVFSSNFLNDIILSDVLKNNILSDVIIIVPLGTGGGLKTNGGTPIFMNGVRVHVIYLILPKEKNRITESMLGWSKFAATNGGGTFSILTIIEGPGGKPDEEDLVKKVKDHVLKLVQKFSY